MAPSSARLVAAAWSVFQPSTGLDPLPMNRVGGLDVARAFVRSKLVDASQCTLEANPEPADFLDLLEAEAAKPGDAFYVYICSHGLYPFGSPYRLATARTTTTQDTGRSLVVADVLRIVSASPAPHKALFLDACFAGGASTALADLALGGDQPADCAVIAASSALEAADAGRGTELPAFSAALVEALATIGRRPKPSYSLATVFTEVERVLGDDGVAPRLYAAGRADHPLPRPGSGDTTQIDAPPPEPRVSVLYVDDERVRRAAFVDSLSAIDRVVVESVETSDEARQKLVSRYYDLVLVDLFLSGDVPATDLLDIIATEAPQARTVLVTRLGKGTEDAWSKLNSIFKYPTPVRALVFKNQNRHIDFAEEVLQDLLADRCDVLDLVAGASDAAAQVATRAAASDRDATESPSDARAPLELEALALIHEVLKPWLSPGVGPSYVTSFTMSPFGAGRSSCAVFLVEPTLEQFVDSPVSQLVMRSAPAPRSRRRCAATTPSSRWASR